VLALSCPRLTTSKYLVMWTEEDVGLFTFPTPGPPRKFGSAPKRIREIRHLWTVSQQPS
jgi:hypothetical protein